jgi:ribosomal protein S21
VIARPPSPGTLPGVAVEPRAEESPGSLIRRFQRVVLRSGVLGDLRRRRYYRSPGERARHKRRAAEQRKRKHEQQRARRREAWA